MATQGVRLRVQAAARVRVAAARAPVVAPHVRAADAPVGMVGSVVGDAVGHHSRRHVLSAKRCAQQGQ